MNNTTHAIGGIGPAQGPGIRAQMEEEARKSSATLETEADPLTIAYIGIGAASRWDAAGDLPTHIVDGFGGQLGYIGEAIEHAAMLDAMAEGAGDDLIGVFAYEVAEAFGQLIGDWLLRDGGVSTTDARIVARQLIDAITA